jgi:predicted RNA-binding protein YlqC (UPF0109 family)
MSLSDMVETMVKHTVQEPDVVTVSKKRDRGATIYNVTVSPNDVGRVIGKDGRVIQCIRKVIAAAGEKSREKAIVKVVTQD